VAEERKHDPEARIQADDIVRWAERLNVTPEELRSAIQRGGEMVKDVVEELKRRGQDPGPRS
jgi:hypothetical protein